MKSIGIKKNVQLTGVQGNALRPEHSKAILGVNIDHVATLRQLRGTPYPDLVEAAHAAELGGADQITVHLREDRRHIQDADVRLLRKKISGLLNLEMAANPEMTAFARKIRPDWVCLVPEKRQELTTEGGLNMTRNQKELARTIAGVQKSKIRVSCFVEPSEADVRAAHALGAEAVELHTGKYCLATQNAFGARSSAMVKKELTRILSAATLARELGLRVHAGHGFDAHNVQAVAGLRTEGDPKRSPQRLPQRLIAEFNIGHVLVCRAVLVGLEQAVREMVTAIR